MSEVVDIAPATGRLGVLLPGLGAVSTTFIAGVLALRKRLAQPIGSLTQLGTVRLGKRIYVPASALDRMADAAIEKMMAQTEANTGI